MKTLEIIAYGRTQRRYTNLTQDRLDTLLDEWNFEGSTTECDDDEMNWTVDVTKNWIPVYQHKGREILFLNNAGTNDCHDYKISPGIEPGATYKTVGDAIAAIDQKS